MSLSALPNELKLGFIHYLDPESTLYFALTCKDYAYLCKSTLKVHTQRLAENQSINTDSGVNFLWKLLLAILEDPSKGWYIRELNLPATRQYNWLEDPHDPRPIPSKADIGIFKFAAQKLQDIYPVLHPSDETYSPHEDFANSNNIPVTIQDRIDSGFEDAILILLLHYLPFLTTIRLTAIDTEGLEVALSRIARAYVHSSRPSTLPLRHLKTFSIAHWDTEFCCSPDWACTLSCLPNLTTLVARQMGNEPSDLFTEKLSLAGSSLTEVFFQECQFDAEKFNTVLAHMPGLKKFTYIAGGATVSDCAFEPKKIIKALSEHVAHSLEDLYLDAEGWGGDIDDDTDLPTITLVPFTSLHTLTCLYSLLRPLPASPSLPSSPLSDGFYTAPSPPSTEIFDVRTILPASLEKLYLHGLFDEGREGTTEEWELFKHMFDETSEVVPKLTRENVWIGRMGRVGWEVEEAIGGAGEMVPYWKKELARLLEGHGV